MYTEKNCCRTYVIQRYTRGVNVDMAKKEVISIRVSSEFKSKLESEAKLKEVSVSELILDTLNMRGIIKMSYNKKIEELEQKFEKNLEGNEIEKKRMVESYESKIKEIEKKLEDSAEESKKLFETLQGEQTLLSEQQKLLSQQQELQLFTQRQIEQLQQEKQMLIEIKQTKKKWWQFWASID